MQFIVIIAMYNMETWISSNIDILQRQSHSGFRCFIGDDLSTDNSVQLVQNIIDGDPRFECVQHQQKKFSMGNIHTLIEYARPQDEDVIVLVDGDDRLAHEMVLERLADTYQQYDCWMTFGSYSDGNNIPDAICGPYPERVIHNNLYRKARWRASHLKSFKYKLWKRLPPTTFSISETELQQARRRALLTGQWQRWWHWRRLHTVDLLDPTQRFVRRCSDKAMTLPMLELAGERARFVPDILYFYNSYEKDLQFNVKKARQKWHTRCIRDILRHKPALKPID